jgi:hypothetical protein
MSKIDNKMMSAPYKPDPLKYNFDEYEFNKGNDAFLLKFYKNTTRDNNKVKPLLFTLSKRIDKLNQFFRTFILTGLLKSIHISRFIKKTQTYLYKG